MPPKKDAKKGGEAEPELGPEEMLLRSKLRIESLERELVARSEVMNKAVAEQMKMRQKVAEFHQDFVKEKQDTFAITSDMTRQYKQMQEDLLRRNNEQQLQIEDLKDQVRSLPGQFFELPFLQLQPRSEFRQKHSLVFLAVTPQNHAPLSANCGLIAASKCAQRTSCPNQRKR